MKLLYFAWVRERIGKAEEDVDPPAGRRDGRRTGGLARAARRGIRLRLRESEDDPRRDRQEPRARRCADRRRRRDRIFSADDRRVGAVAAMTTTIRLQREAFDTAAEAAALTRGRTDIGAVVTFTGVCRADENGEPIAA